MNRIKIKLFSLFVITCFISFSSHAVSQEINVKGRVVTFNTYGLNKVTVTAKNTGVETVTDTAGYYSITCNPDDKLIFEANGFFKEKVNLKSKTTHEIYVNLKLKSGDKNIEIATGYGYIEKDKLSHAIEHIESNNDFSGYESVLDIIRGRFPGVNVGTNSITIRGTDTFEGENALIVVDGVVVDFSVMKNIPPSQIKSVNILKGASASARYGSRGMGGVIVIQTKSKK